MIGNKIGIKSKKESTDQKKAPIQSKTGPATKSHKKKIVSNYPDARKENTPGQSSRYKGSNARPQVNRKPHEDKNRTAAGTNKPSGEQRQRPKPSNRIKTNSNGKETPSAREKTPNKPSPQKKVNIPEKKIKESKKAEEVKKPVEINEADRERHIKSRVQREGIKPPALRIKNKPIPPKEEFGETEKDTISSDDIISTTIKETEITSLGSETAEDISRSVRIPSEKKEAEERKVSEEKKALHGDWNISLFPVPEAEGKLRFHDFDIPDTLMHAIADLNFQYCTPIQQEILSKSLSGKDAIGQAQTGTGKTAAFLITILSRLTKEPIAEQRRPGAPRALILAPTRELVMQIYKDAIGLAKYMDLNIQAVFGGMDYAKQRAKLHAKPVDIIIATPGRLIDFFNRKELFLNKAEIVVIDEADRMLDMGFIPDVKKIIRATPMKDKRQTLFFSATIDNDVMHLSESWTTDSLNVKIEPDELIVKNIEQIIYITTSDKKYPLLYNLITKQNLDKVMVFTNRRDEARDLGVKLYASGIECDVLSGDVLQKKRVKTLEDFRNGIIKVLVATDVAGRGIHIESISHVINYTLPEDPEDYVHRVGRTGRAGASGISISFATEDDSFQIPAIEKYVGKKLIYSYPEDEYLVEPPSVVREPKDFASPEKHPVRKNNFSGKTFNRKGPRSGPRHNKPDKPSGPKE